MIDPSDVGFALSHDLTRRFSGARITWRHGLDEYNQDNHDIAAIELPWEGCEELFLEWRARPSKCEDLILVGYPTGLRQFELDTKGRLKGATDSQILCDIDVLEWNTSGLCVGSVCQTDEIVDQVNGDFDGLSGAPILGFDPQNGEFNVRGIVIRGGNGIVRFMPAQWVERLLLQAVSPPASPAQPSNAA